MTTVIYREGEIRLLKELVRAAGREIERKDAALDKAIRALDQLSKKGSITKQLREETMRELWEARQTLLVDKEA